MNSYFLYALFFIVGLFCGSLINYLAGGLIREPRSFPFSNCRNCTVKWRPVLMLPVIGYLMARARCPHCGKPLHVHLILVEIGTGALMTYLFWRYGLGWELSVLVIYSLLLMILLVTDIEQMLIPNAVTYPAYIIVFIISAVMMMIGVKPDWFVPLPVSGFWLIMYNYLVNSLAGGVTGFVLLFLIAIAARGGMGFGDVKLAALIGLMAGFPIVIVALFIGIIGGGLVAGVLLLTKRRGRKDPMPFGPFLCLGGIVALLWGREIIIWYLSPIL